MSPNCGKNLQKPSVKQILVLSAALLTIPVLAASARADSDLFFYKFGTGQNAAR
jgi:hypothetical protein